MEIKIKEAKEEDFNKIKEFNFLLFKNDYQFDPTLNLEWPNTKEGEEYFKKAIKSNDYCVFIASLDGNSVGYIIGSKHNTEKWRKKIILGELENMLVLEKYRSSRIGSKLVEKFLEWCKSKNIKKIKVISSAQNKDAIDFYKKNGFEEYSLALERDV